jgi:hypothetical protein
VLKEQLGENGNPAVRARAAMAMAGALADPNLKIDAMDVAEEIGADAVFTYIGGLLMNGGTETLARQVFEGQRIIAARDAPLPAIAQQRGAAFLAVRDVLSFGTDPVRGDADDRAMYDQITGAAMALYASRAAQDGEFKDGVLRETDFLQAVHEVMGGTGKYDGRQATGGVREIAGTLTILPVGVRARDIEAGLNAVGVDITRDPRVMSVRAADGAGSVDGLGTILGATDDVGDAVALRGEPVSEEVLRGLSANNTIPMFGGQPMDIVTWQRGRLRANGNGTYTMEFIHQASGEARIALDEKGDPWLINMRALIEVGRQ